MFITMPIFPVHSLGGLLIKRTTRPVSKKGSNAAPHSRLAIAHCRSGVTATRIISKYYIEVTSGSVEVCASLCECVAIVFPCRRGPARAACPSRSRRSMAARAVRPDRDRTRFYGGRMDADQPLCFQI
ncbi:hypothetical protein EVG18_25850 [Burkholderia pyrrocinia]|nr:hypothetical protein EVG18_25850 [Burkholderia pyrrocinia]